MLRVNVGLVRQPADFDRYLTPFTVIQATFES